MINADRLHITSVIYNLLDNALKYSYENPEIAVKVTSHDEHITLCISDKGIGISPEYKQKIFEKFFRVPGDGHHDTKGYGLGLSYVNQVVQQHMGFVEVQTEPGKGSNFWVNLPYKESAVIHYGKGRIIRKLKI